MRDKRMRVLEGVCRGGDARWWVMMVMVRGEVRNELRVNTKLGSRPYEGRGEVMV